MSGLLERKAPMTDDWKEICDNLDYAYQPIVNSYTGDVFGYEALLRNWKTCGFKSIFDVFDQSFSDRTLYAVDLELRKKAIEKYCTIDGNKSKALFYNLDNRVLEMPDYGPGNTQVMLDSLDMDQSNFYFELSERHELCSDSETIEILNQYKRQNFRIAIDDYGSGYSGLQLLYHSEPDIIKIDRFFIDGVHKDQKKKLFAENIVNMSHLMGIKVVAEGIETYQELNFCREIGCDYLQGFYIAHPEQDVQKLSCTYNLDHGTSSFGKRKGENQSLLIEESLTKTTAVKLHDDGVSTLKRFQKDSSIGLLPVTNEMNEPIGVICEKDLKQYVYSPFGISLFQHHSNSRGLESFVTRIPMADVNCSLEKILDISAAYKKSEGILITRNGKYLGLLDSSSLIQLIYEQKLAYARNQNPLTGLPGNFSIHKELASVLEKRNTCNRIIFFDFNNFKPFNDTYGFRMGDRLIILFTEILKKTFNRDKDFIGHVGGDDFLLIQSDPQEDTACDMTKQAQAFFTTGALAYYSEEHRLKGYLRARNRKGQWESYSLMSVSAAVLDVENPGTTTLDQLNHLLSELKKQAKSRQNHFARFELNQRMSDLATTSSRAFNSEMN